MRIPFTVYETATGRIVSTGRAPGFPSAATQPWGDHLGWLPVSADETADWVDPAGSTSFMDETETFVTLPGTATPRPDLPRFDKTAIAADGLDAATLAGLPDGATVSVDGGEPQDLANDTLSIVATMPASYRVVVSRWPYLDYGETIVAA